MKTEVVVYSGGEAKPKTSLGFKALNRSDTPSYLIQLTQQTASAH